MTWHDAFLKQAHSDYSVFLKLNQSRLPLCHKLHYLQMATEKLAKAFQCKNNIPPPRTHYILVKMLRVIMGTPSIKKQLGYNKKDSYYQSYIRSLLPVASQIEDLAPVGGNLDKLNPEYPWEKPIGNINCPANHHYNEIKQTDLAKFQILIRNLFNIKGIRV